MIQIVVNSRDITQIVEQVTWSGDTKQVARKLAFTVARRESDPYLPKVSIDVGSPVLLLQDGKTLFGGLIFGVDKSASGNTVAYTAYDYMYYVNQSSVSKVYSGTPEAITRQVCAELGVSCGSLAATGVHVYMPCFGKKAYDVIMMGYTVASRRNSLKYIPVVQDVNKVAVIVKGNYCGVVLDGSYNLTEASYKASLDKLVNRVLITDKNGKVIDRVEDAFSRAKYGTIQSIYKKEDDKDARSEARKLLQGIEQSGGVTAVSDTRAISGYAIAVQEPVSGLYGKFWIESDSHTFSNVKSEMQLTLAFENLMDEKEIEKEKKSSKK